MTQLLLDIAPDWKPTLDNFVAGRNTELLAALREALAGNRDGCFYLWGEAGSGKSHLLQAVTAQARAAGSDAICLCGEVPPALSVWMPPPRRDCSCSTTGCARTAGCCW